MAATALYDKDYQHWLDRHIDLLKQGRLAELDIEHLIEELQSMGSRDRREMVSHLIILIAHLLKWEYQPDYRGRSWRSSISEQRVQLEEQLEESPSLKPQAPDLLIKAYPKAVKMAAKETGLAVSTFPVECPYPLDALLDSDFYPVEH
jgi:hypothetical protein